MKNTYMPFLHCISSFEGTSYQNLDISTHQIFLFFLAFMSAGIIHPLNGQSTKHDKSFLLMLPNLIVVIL